MAPPLPTKKKAAGFSAKSLKSVVKQKVLPTVQAISGMGELSRRMKELRSIIGTKDEEIRQLKRKVLVLSDINGLSVKDVAAALERAARKRADPDEYSKSESREAKSKPRKWNSKETCSVCLRSPRCSSFHLRAFIRDSQART